MTACFVFELRSKVEPEKVREKLWEIWNRGVGGWKVDVFQHEKNGTLICYLDYYFPDDLECRERIEKILKYLFKVAIDGHIYYYRFEEALDSYLRAKRKITLDLLFGEYAPTLGGKCLRYEIVRFSY